MPPRPPLSKNQKFDDELLATTQYSQKKRIHVEKTRRNPSPGLRFSKTLDIRMDWPCGVLLTILGIVTECQPYLAIDGESGSQRPNNIPNKKPVFYADKERTASVQATGSAVETIDTGVRSERAANAEFFVSS